MIQRYRRYRAERRWLIALCVVGVVVFHGVIAARLFLSPEQFRLRTHRLLQGVWPGTLEIGGAGYRFPREFHIDGIRLSRLEEQGGGELFACEAISVSFRWLSLLRGQMVLDDLELVRPTLALEKADFAEMKRPAEEPSRTEVARVIVRGGCVRLGAGILFPGSPEQELREVDLDLRQERHRESAYAFEGSADSDLWGRCDLEGTVDLGRGRLDVNVVARGIAIAEPVRRLLPEVANRLLDRYRIAGVVDLTVAASVAWGGPEKPQVKMVKATLDLRDCQAAWERFPLQVTDIRGRVVFDGTNLYYREISGRCGPATVEIDGRTTPEKIEVRMAVRGRPLDQEFYSKAYEELQDVWDRCGVQGGVLDVDYQSTWHRVDEIYEGSVLSRLRDVRATYSMFPYPLHDIVGAIRWEGGTDADGTSHGVSRFESLRGRNGTARVEVTGQVDDLGVPDLHIRAFDVPFDPTLRTALGPEWQKTYDSLRPQGTTEVDCRVTSPKGDPDVLDYRIAIRPQGASFRYGSFAHTVTDVRGEIQLDEKGTVTFRDLTGRLGTIPLQFLGGVRPSDQGPLADITVVASDVELGPDVRDILGKGWQVVYDQLDPRGKVAFSWRFGADPKSGEPRETSEIQCLQDCSILHRQFPVRITSLMGRIYVDESGRTTFTNVRGRIGGAAIEALAGEYRPGPDGGLRFTLKGRGLLLDEAIRRAIPKNWHDTWGELQPAGEVDVEYQFTENPRDPEHPVQRISIEPVDAAFTCRKFPLPVTDVRRGKIAFDQDGNATISNVQGKVHGKTVQLAGKVKAGPKATTLELDVHAAELALNDELRSVLPTPWQETWDRFRPSGTIAASAAVVADLLQGELTQFDIDVTLNGCRATYAGLPVPLVDLRGRLEFQDEETRVVDVVGRSPVADRVRLGGRVANLAGQRTRLELHAQGLHLGEELRAALPDGVRKALESIELQGTADVDLAFSEPTSADQPTECSGTVVLRGASFRRLQPFSQVNGEIRIDKGVVRPDGTQEFRGSVRLRRLLARALVVTDLAGGFAYLDRGSSNQADGRSTLSFTDLGGGFYGGRLSATAHIGLTGQRPFAGRIALNDVDFKVLCREALGIEKEVPGTLDLRLEFPPGRYKGQAGLVGDGKASVRDGELGDLPLAASLFNVVGFRSPLDRSITEAEMKFGIAAEDYLDVKELTLSGETRLITGSGRVDFDRRLDLTFYSPKKGTILDELIRVLPDNLIEIKVRGTATEPETRVNAVPIIPRALEQFNQVFNFWRQRRPEIPKRRSGPFNE